ncbi:MAG TPA: acyloxyacyl hydrolase [Nitrospira sp.]|nr:acyloxyacyl hydrolase [Nitrospira sp.]
MNNTPIPLTGCTVALCVFFLFAPWPSKADETRLMSIGLRAGITGASVLGEEQLQTFREYEVIAQIGLPLDWYSESGWGLGTRLLVSAGALNGGGDTGFITSLVPVLSLGSRDGRFSLDFGIGGALLSNHQFGQQDFGGPFQVVGTLGASFRSTAALTPATGSNIIPMRASTAPINMAIVVAQISTWSSSPIDFETGRPRSPGAFRNIEPALVN